MASRKRTVSTLASRILKASSLLRSEYIAYRILSIMHEVLIYKFLGRDNILPIHRFNLDGYTNRLFQDHPSLNSESCVVVLGGYLGDSAFEWSNRYKCKVHVFEPIPFFLQRLENRFSSDTNIVLHGVAASNKDSRIKMGLRGESTGVFEVGVESIEVRAVDIDPSLQSISDIIDLVEINIEGGEYEVLNRLIDSGRIKRIRKLLIQFHQNFDEAEFERAKIRKLLRQSHREVFNYEWIWESWEIVPE